MKMGVVAFFVAGAVLLFAAVLTWSRSENRETKKILETMLAVDKNLASVMKSLAEQDNELSELKLKFSNYNAQLLSHEDKFEKQSDGLMLLEKKIDAVDLQSKVPRSLSVKLSEPIKMEPLRVNVVYRQAQKVKAPELPSEKVINHVKSKLKELSN